MIKTKVASDTIKKIFSNPVIIIISIIIGGNITGKMVNHTLDFLFFLPIFTFIVYGVIKILLSILERILQKLYKQEINISIPKQKIKAMIEHNYIEVPELNSIMEVENEKIASDKCYEYLKEQEDRIKNSIINHIHQINPKNNEYYRELKEVILKNISEETSIRSLYNMLISLVMNSKITIAHSLEDNNAIDAVNMFYETIGEMSKYNYVLDLQKYENRRTSLLKYVEHGNLLIDQFIKEISIKQKGEKGEKNVEEQMKLYDDYITYLTNIRFEVDNTSIETDGIIVSDKGIFSLEIKNYGDENDTIVLRKDGKLSIINKYNKERQLDFVNQHNRHCGLQQKLINSELKKSGINTDYIIINPIIVIGNDKVNIENESDIKILRASSVIHEILKIKENTLSKEVQNEIVKIINDNKLELKSYDVINIENSLSIVLDNLVKGINYLIEVCNLNEKVYNTISQNSHIEITSLNLMNNNLFNGERSSFYQFAIGLKN